MGKEKPTRSEPQELTAEEQAAEIESLISSGKGVDDIVSKYTQLADGWDLVGVESKAKAIGDLVLEDYDLDAIMAEYPELTGGLETYTERFATKQKVANRPARGGGAMGVGVPEFGQP